MKILIPVQYTCLTVRMEGLCLVYSIILLCSENGAGFLLFEWVFLDGVDERVLLYRPVTEVDDLSSCLGHLCALHFHMHPQVFYFWQQLALVLKRVPMVWHGEYEVLDERWLPCCRVETYTMWMSSLLIESTLSIPLVQLTLHGYTGGVLISYP